SRWRRSSSGSPHSSWPTPAPCGGTEDRCAARAACPSASDPPRRHRPPPPRPDPAGAVARLPLRVRDTFDYACLVAQNVRVVQLRVVQLYERTGMSDIDAAEIPLRQNVEGDFGPVTDWATDFDMFDPDYVRDPATRWAEQRERCPIAFTERRQRTWLPVRYKDLADIAHDVEHFSSHDPIVVSPLEIPINDVMPIAPISSDPPVHTWSRRLLLPAFGPSAIDKMTPITRALCNDLIDEHFAGRHEADAAADYAQHIPVRVISQMIGIPVEDQPMLTGGAGRP